MSKQERDRRYRETHRDARSALRRDYYARHRDAECEYSRHWYDAHREEILSKKRASWLRKKAERSREATRHMTSLLPVGDRRSRIEKLQMMANQTSSPFEAEIARAKLQNMSEAQA